MLNNSSVPMLNFYKKFNVPAVPWEVFEFLQQEQNKERSRFLINNQDIICWVYDCLLGNKNPADKAFPLSEKDALYIQENSPSLYQTLDQWLNDLRFSLQMKPQKAISKEGFVFDCLVGNYNPVNENVIKILHSMNYFCPVQEENLIEPITAIKIDKETLKDIYFDVSIDSELYKKKTFSDLRDSFFNSFSNNPYLANRRIGIDRNFFPIAARQEKVLPLVNSFLLHVPEVLKKYIFGTMMLSAYENSFPRVENIFKHFEKMPLKFISTDKTIRTFCVDAENHLVEVKTDQEALNLVQIPTPAEHRATARPQYEEFSEPENRPSPPRRRMR